MGDLFTNFFIMATTLQKQRRSVPQCLLRIAKLRERMFLCGGKPGSIGEDQCLKITEMRIRNLMKKKIPCVVLCADNGFADLLYDSYGDELTVFGQNRNYDPFGGCQDPEQLLQGIIENSGIPEVRMHCKALVLFCRQLVTVLKILYGKDGISCKRFLELTGYVTGSETAKDLFGHFDQDLTLPVSLMQDIYGLWDTIHDPFVQFAEAFRRSFARLTTHSPDDSCSGIPAELSDNRILIFRLSSAEEPAACAIWYELQNLCSKGQPFGLVDYAIPLPKKTAEQLLDPSLALPYLSYFPTMKEETVPFSLLSHRLSTMICVGAASYGDAERITELAALVLDTPNAYTLHPALLVAGRRGIPDGSACILTPYSLECCAWLST